ncbi:MAG: hypothetical protein OSJ62_07900 [Lachnospiraceae bacterium]|nr:hypothetical protein [Lachnospiraceae bacterium]
MQRERDLVLNPNEYAYVLDKTKGLISCVVGSYKMSLSTSDALVVFNERSKRFEEVGFEKAITTFTTAPENWYVVLKNPAVDHRHPVPGTANSLPELQIGKKVNIRGNVSFALYPGQMAKAIQGHRLHFNQYLLARVYDADALEVEEAAKKEGKSARERKNSYITGQLLVIKGTEVSFYIPPTGIEVIPAEGSGNNYIRDAVTLEKLEYCILKNEEGEKKYVHGSAVVFPKPDETFVENPEGGYKFKAIELSEISGIYVKVVSGYEENGVRYTAGEELFITGREQMIYYPRPEHAIIDYEGKVIHHAIAIPTGEGRYILERKTGRIKMVRGASMYLVNPIEEVVVRRKLTKRQCELWYPGNDKVLKYNDIIQEEFEEEAAAGIPASCLLGIPSFLKNGFLGQENAVVEDAGFSRKSTYSKPRTITIDNKYDGVVSIDVWTGYAVNVISKSGNRKVVLGPITYLMEYDETLEVLSLSTGKPKTASCLLHTVYLQTNNNKVSDRVELQTKDFVTVWVEVSYCVDFLPEYQEKWFRVENYVKYLCDRMKSLLKREAKNYSIEKFYADASDIIRNVVLDLKNSENLQKEGRIFQENGMWVHDVEILSVRAEDAVQKMIDSYQKSTIEKTLELSAAEKELKVIKKLSDSRKEEAELQYQVNSYKLVLENKLKLERISSEETEKRAKEAAFRAVKEEEASVQSMLDQILKAKLARRKEWEDAELYRQEKLGRFELERQSAYIEAVRKVFESISPELVASMTAQANAELIGTVSKAMGAYAIAGKESVSDVTNRLLRGTSLEGLLQELLDAEGTKKE